MQITLGDGRESPYFTALLSPHRSLSDKGFNLLMAFFALISLIAGCFFLSIGAWPIMGFFGLDVLLLYLAFRASYKWSAIYETVVLTENVLEITHQPLRGEEKRWNFNPYWVRLKILERRGQNCLLEATSHGRRLIFANFLSDTEKRDLACQLGRALTSLHGR